MNYLFLILAPIILYLINNYLKNKSYLLNYSGDTHQIFTLEKKIPLSGGIFILFYFILFFNHQIELNIFISILFLLGLFSDSKFFYSAKIRFFLQIAILFAFIFCNDLVLKNTKVIFLDQVLKYEFYNYLFVLFCILILINGTNFIDGLNTNVLGYYIIVSYFIFDANTEFFLINFSAWTLWITFLVILYLFNFFNKLFIGDSGSYLLGFIYGYILIKLYMDTQSVSSIYIITLVWYPCFETLFSIIRKFKLNQSPILPDTKHFHQLLYMSIKKKFKFSNLRSNVMSGSIINLYNFISIFIASLHSNNTQYQILIITLNIIVYYFLYLRLLKNNYSLKNRF